MSDIIILDETDHTPPTNDVEMTTVQTIDRLKEFINNSDNNESSSDVVEISDSDSTFDLDQNSKHGFHNNISSWSDLETSDSDSDELDVQEKKLSHMIQSLLNDKTPAETLEKLPHLLLYNSQTSVKISPAQLEDILFEKAANRLISHNKLGDQMFQAKYLNEELNGWVNKFTKLQQFVSILKKRVSKLEKERKPPIPTVHRVRSVGTYVNFPVIKNTAAAKTSKTEPLIITLD